MIHAHPKPAKLDAWIHLKVTTWFLVLHSPHSHLFYHLLPSVCLVHLLSSGLLSIAHCVTCAWPQTSFNAWSELPGHPRLEPAVTDSTQRTTTPKALEEFKVEDDCNEGQMEKDCGVVRWMKAKAMAAPPRIIKNLIYWYHRPNCSFSERIPSSRGNAMRRGQDGLGDLALLGRNC